MVASIGFSSSGGGANRQVDRDACGSASWRSHSRPATRNPSVTSTKIDAIEASGPRRLDRLVGAMIEAAGIIVRDLLLPTSRTDRAIGEIVNRRGLPMARPLARTLQRAVAEQRRLQLAGVPAGA